MPRLPRLPSRHPTARAPRLLALLVAVALAAVAPSQAQAEPQTTSKTTTSTTSTTTVTGGPGSTQVTTTTKSKSKTVTTTAPSKVVTEPPPVRIGGQSWGVEIGGAAAPAAAGAGAAAGDDADFGPTQPVYRIVLYDRADFRGKSVGVTMDTPNLATRKFAAAASSLRVQGGAWEICTGPNYTGRCQIVTSAMDLDAAGLGDAVQSIRRAK